MKEVVFDKLVKKILTNKIVFGLIFPVVVAVVFISWIIFHQNQHKILSLIFRVLKIVAVLVLVPQVYKLISERNKSAKPFLIVLGIL